jgi:ParB-like chromosome segregation protein Spo0J
MPETGTIALRDITAAKHRLRALREKCVTALAQSMADQGQLQPIVVRREVAGGYCLVAGLHRLEAAKRLKWAEINCTVFDDIDADQAELVEIDENLIRAALTPAEEAAHLGKRKELYEKMYPETKHGAVGRRGKRLQNATSSGPADSFIDDIAKKTGEHRATVARKAARAKKVVVLPDIVGTSLDKGSEIDALSKLPVEKQRSLAEVAKRGEQVSAVTEFSACDPEASKTSDGTGKEAEPAPTLDPRAWSISTAQQRQEFVKAVGRSEIEDAFHPIESGYALTRGLNTLNQAWIAATESDQRTFYRELFPANVRNRFQT